MHFAQNLQDTPGAFIASFANVDFGTLTISRQLFRFPAVSLAATLGLSIDNTTRLAKIAVAQDIISKSDCKPTSPKGGGYPM